MHEWMNMVCTEVLVLPKIYKKFLERTCEEIAAAQKLLEYDTIVVAVEASWFGMEKPDPSNRHSQSGPGRHIHVWYKVELNIMW